MNLQELRELISYDEVSGEFTWLRYRSRLAKKGSTAGTLNKDGAVAIMVKGKLYKAHRLAWFYKYGKWPNDLIDHIDGNPANNAISNLREANKSENAQNRKRSHTSHCLGVTADPDGVRWIAQIGLKGYNEYLGCFDTEKEASDAYVARKRELHPFCTI